MNDIKIEKQRDTRDLSINNINLDNTIIDNVNLIKSNEKLNFEKNVNSDKKIKPKLVPLDGLDLLTNPNKTNDKKLVENNSNDSDSDDLSNSDSDNMSEYSTENSKINLNQNMFKQNKNNDNDSDIESIKSNSSILSSKSSSISGSRRSSRSNSSSNFKQQKTYEEILREKQSFLYKLDRLEKSLKLKNTRKFTIQSNLEDIKTEYEKLKHQRDVDKSIKFQRRALMFLVSGVELFNNKFDPIDAKLDGWSETIMENIDDYDEVFEELHDKYAEKIQMAPELKLLMMVGGSGFMFHLSNTLLKSNVPSLNEVLKQNPDIMRNITQAALNNMSKNMGDKDPMYNMMKDSVNMQQQKNDTKYEEKSESNYKQQTTMNGPSGVDDILNEINKQKQQTTFTSNIKSKGKRQPVSGNININI